jgi:hypothetical protein
LPRSWYYWKNPLAGHTLFFQFLFSLTFIYQSPEILTWVYSEYVFACMCSFKICMYVFKSCKWYIVLKFCWAVCMCDRTGDWT